MANTNTRRRTLLWIGVPVVAVLLVAGFFAMRMMAPPPADLDYARTQTSEKGLFVATIEPGADPIAVNQMHSWTVGVAMADGSALDPSAITIDGGMPQHGHGLPTAPQVVADLGGGKFAVEGMKFNMGGWWVVKVHVVTPQGEDVATFNLSL